MRTSTLLTIGLATLTVAAPSYSNHGAREALRECKTDKDCGGGYKCQLPDNMAIMTDEQIPGTCQQLGGPRKPGMEDNDSYKMEVPDGTEEKANKDEKSNKDEEKSVQDEATKTSVTSPEKTGDSAGKKDDQTSGGFQENGDDDDDDNDEDCDDEDDEDDWEDCDEDEEDEDDEDCDEDEGDNVIIGGSYGSKSEGKVGGDDTKDESDDGTKTKTGDATKTATGDATSTATGDATKTKTGDATQPTTPTTDGDGTPDRTSGDGSCVMKDAQGQMQVQVCMTDEQIAKECKEVKGNKCVVKEEGSGGEGDGSQGSSGKTTKENTDEKTKQEEDKGNDDSQNEYKRDAGQKMTWSA